MPDPSPVRAALTAVEGFAAVDEPAQAIAKKVRGVLKPGAAKDAISGTWMGHPLHPVLTDVVIGTWISALLLDLVGGRRDAGAAQRLLATGVLASLPTAASGATDWADAEPASAPVRRIGAVHALSNSAALGLQLASLRARRRGDRGRGVALSLVANGVLTAGAALGGHLSFAQGIGVDQTAFDPGADDWTPVQLDEPLRDGEPVAAQAGDAPVLLVRLDGRVRAIHDRCSHRGCSLASGTIDGDVVECACHGSRFALDDGALLRGPAIAGQPAFEARESDGRIEVRRAPAPAAAPG